jgi:acetylornithine deacetylase/succinyl-diaminopimelate desuccinylase-like protein
MKRALVAFVLFVASAGPARSAEVVTSADRALARAIYEELIEIDTSRSSGSTTLAAEAVAARLRASGIPEADIVVLGPSEKRGNLVARLRGSGAEKPLLLLAHLDVVEARREDWTVEPFRLLEKDGFFYGRGTLDDKAMAAIFTQALIRMKSERTPLRRDVILALTADEEGGDENGVDWLLHEHRPLVDAGLVLNEGGGGRMRAGKYLLNGVQAAEKTYMDYELVVTNKGGHSSLPVKENAIYRLANGLTRVERLEFPTQLNAVTRSYFERAAQVETPEVAKDMRAVAKHPPDAAAVARLAAHPSYNAMLRTTCVATELAGGHAPNALPQRASANVNCRILPGHSAAEVRSALVGALADPQIEVALAEREIAGPEAVIDPAVLATIERVSAEVFPGVPVVPMMSAGATDSKYFRLAGIPAYGVSGLFVDVDDVRAHGRDERLGVAQFYEGQDFLWRLVQALAGADAASSGR